MSVQTPAPSTAAPTTTPTAAPRPAAPPTFIGATTQNSPVQVTFSILQSGGSTTAQDTSSSTDATSFITGAPTTGRRVRRQETGGDLFELAVVNNPFLTADEARVVAARAAKLHSAAGKNLTVNVGAQITVPCRARVNAQGLATVVDDNGNPTEDAERCEDRDPEEFCQEIPGCTEQIDARLTMRIDKAVSHPLACENRVWEGDATPLFEEYPVRSGKKGSPPTYRPVPSIVNLLTTPNERAPHLLSHCPNLASAFIKGDGNADDGGYLGESCGRRFYSGQEQYVCDSVDLTLGCFGAHASPRYPELQEACFEICAVLGTNLCNGYSVDLNPVNPSHADIDTRPLFGRCFLFHRPLEDRSPSAPQSPNQDYLQFHRSCHFTSSVLNVSLLPDYADQDEFCSDPAVLIPVLPARTPRLTGILSTSSCASSLDI